MNEIESSHSRDRQKTQDARCNVDSNAVSSRRSTMEALTLLSGEPVWEGISPSGARSVLCKSPDGLRFGLWRLYLGAAANSTGAKMPSSPIKTPHTIYCGETFENLAKVDGG